MAGDGEDAMEKLKKSLVLTNKIYDSVQEVQGDGNTTTPGGKFPSLYINELLKPHIGKKVHILIEVVKEI